MDDGSCIYVDGVCESCSDETDGTGLIIDNDIDNDIVSQGDVDKARQTSVMAAGFLAEYLAPLTKRFGDLLEALPAQLAPQRQTLPDPIELCGPSGNMSLTIHVGKEATERVTLPLDSIFWVEE